MSFSRSEPFGQRGARLVIAAPQGRTGKTTVTLGLLASLAARGLAVQPFKKGPDYIDPSWLGAAAGRPCRNLDPFFLQTPERMRASFWRGSRNADLSIIEGNHGLYDSTDESGVGSTADLARGLGAPIVLVVSVARMGRSVAALVSGFQHFEPETPIRGVILNQAAADGARHASRLRSAIERHCDLPVFGILPRDERLTIPDRHLGLVPHGEADGALSPFLHCRRAVEAHVDVERLLALAASAPNLAIPDVSDGPASPGTVAVRIGILRDRAFTFYYPENLEALEDAGAELVPIDAFTAPELPSVDALYIGGGFPEMFMADLQANAALRLAVRRAAGEGLPIYAECGGLIYLARRISWGDRSAEMAGVLPVDVEMTARPQGHGYVAAEVDTPNPFLPVGTCVRGHEFHNTRLTAVDPSLTTAYRLTRGHGIGGGRDGLLMGNVFAAYTHLHAAGAPDWAPGLVARARGAFA